MKKSLTKIVASLWNANFAGHTDATKTKAIIEGETVYIYPEGEENDGTTFYHGDELADVKRAFQLSGYITIRDGKCVAVVY